MSLVDTNAEAERAAQGKRARQGFLAQAFLLVLAVGSIVALGAAEGQVATSLAIGIPLALMFAAVIYLFYRWDSPKWK